MTMLATLACYAKSKKWAVAGYRLVAGLEEVICCRSHETRYQLALPSVPSVLSSRLVTPLQTLWADCHTA